MSPRSPRPLRRGSHRNMPRRLHECTNLVWPDFIHHLPTIDGAPRSIPDPHHPVVAIKNLLCDHCCIFLHMLNLFHYHEMTSGTCACWMPVVSLANLPTSSGLHVTLTLSWSGCAPGGEGSAARPIRAAISLV